MAQSIDQKSLQEKRSDPDRAAVLIIDDNRDTCDMLAAFLSQFYSCDAAYAGEQAMEKIRKRHYSVVLADLMMPNIDGYSIISGVASLSPTTPVIVVSGVTGIQSAIKAMRMGAFDYIIKPFDPEHVELSVKRALSHHIIARTAQHNERRMAAYVSELENLNQSLSKALSDLESVYHSTISALATVLETRNIETRGHSDRVVAYSLKLASHLGMDDEQMKALALGALFHDIGKIGVEDRILLKPMGLTADEWQEMKKHPLKGAKIIEGIPYLSEALPVVAQHHERWDGGGYPAGLSGTDIDLKARVFAVADAVDAITSDRLYDKPRSFQEACDELKTGAGKQFDPQIVEAFCSVPLEEWEKLARELSPVKDAHLNQTA